MPRAKGNAPRAIASGPKWYGFIRCEFDAESKQRFNAWLSDNPFAVVWEWFVETIDAFKISFSYSDAQSCYQVSMTGTKEDEKMYFGWTLTARGRDIERTLAALMFKHEMMLLQKWVKNIEGAPQDDDWVG